MHECFCYENYEAGYDHTFGVVGDDAHHIMHNPGDEGNLVQSAETLKTFGIVAGITAEGNMLSIMPRLPWECTKAIVKDYPVPSSTGMCRISYEYTLDREENHFELKLKGIKDFSQVQVRIGPLPNVLFAEKELQKKWNLSRRYGATFASAVFPVESDSLVVTLINEI